MAAFVVRRFIGMILVLVVVSFFVFLIFIVVPGGDPAIRIAGRTATDQNIENIRKDWGFDQPFYVQYYDMMKKAFTNDLYEQTHQGVSVVNQIKEGVPATFSLAIGAAFIWLSFGILVGVISAVTAGQVSDRLITLFALIGISMPVFWLGILARYFLAEKNTWFPDGGYVPLTENPAQWFYHLILPWFVLAVLFIGFYGRVLRGNILDTINEDYVRTARAKGLSEGAVIRSHVLKNALIPVVTVLGLQLGTLIGGAVITEYVFALPGVGRLVVDAVFARDYPLVQGVVLLIAVGFILSNLAVDLLYGWIDPRIRPR